MNRAHEQLSFNSTRESLRRQRGVTLVELMVALALGLLITVAMLKVYVDASRMYRFNEGLARVQENGRFALEFIRRDARVAGFWGCYSEAPLTNQISATSDAWLDVAAGHITGTNDDGLNSADSITFRSATGSGTLVNTTMTAASDSVSVDSVATITSGMSALISDCDNGDIFQVTGISGTSMAHAAGTNTNTSANLSKTYASGSRVYQAQQSTFCIALGADPLQPSLRRLTNPTSGQTCASNGDELIEGVENMQILYGEDTDADSEGANGDGTANRYVPIGTASLDIDRVVSVRLSLLARSLNNNLTTEPSPYTFNGTAVTPGATDKYLRKVFTTTITLRNKAG
ncbi:MAG TPA: prepilin-type N-terminal cleavage/methylation domain-containing protein [Gammaproteobacteria bacterium]|nr:prepilin-type N-terminal cleavage/methylation domain-containing protein [Gammaproteobacteria bacterium]